MLKEKHLKDRVEVLLLLLLFFADDSQIHAQGLNRKLTVGEDVDECLSLPSFQISEDNLKLSGRVMVVLLRPLYEHYFFFHRPLGHYSTRKPPQTRQEEGEKMHQVSGQKAASFWIIVQLNTTFRHRAHF